MKLFGTSGKILKLSGFVALWCLLFISFILLHTPKASAASNVVIGSRGPAASSAENTATLSSISPWFAVGVGQYNGPFSWAKVYVQTSQLSAGSVSITITQDCSVDVGFPLVTYQLFKMDSSENLTAVTYGQKNGNTGTTACLSSLSYSIPQGTYTASGIVGHTNFAVFYLQASIQNPQSSGDNERSFNFTVGGSGNYVGTAKPQLCILISQNCDTRSTPTYFGIYDRNLGSGCSNDNGYNCNWNYEVQFASQCNQQQPLNQAVNIYDIDAGVYPQPNLSMRVDLDSRTDPNFNWTTGPYKYQTNSAPTETNFLQGSGQFDFYIIQPSVDNGTRYRLVFQDINWRNTIQLFLPFDEFDALQSVGQACIGTFSYSCTPTNQSITMPANTTNNNYLVTVKNTGTAIWKSPDTFRVHKIVNGIVDQGYVSVTNLPLSAPNSQTLPFSVTSPGVGGSPKSFTFILYRNGVQMQGTACHLTISVTGSPPNPTVIFSTNCSNTFVRLKTAATEQYYTYSNVGGSYYVDSSNPPAGQAPDGQNYWVGSPPPAASPQPVGASGNQWTDTNPASPTFGQTFYLYGEVRNGPFSWTPAHDVPIKILWYDVNGNQVDQKTDVLTADSTHWAQNNYPTFTTFSNLWPHNAYWVMLQGEINSSDTFYQGGPYSYTNLLPDRVALTAPNGGNCLQAQADANDKPVCVGGTNIDVEAGQQAPANYTIELMNYTDKTFTSGYNMVIHAERGLQQVGSNSYALRILGNNNGTRQDVIGRFTTISNFEGDYWIEFDFGASRLAYSLTPDYWEGRCPNIETFAHSLPYFQVWSGDISAGGGFASPSGSADTKIIGSCSANYVAPGSQYDGDIRAFGNQTGRKGSEADFGVFAMGLDPGNVGSSIGNIGFYTRDVYTVGKRPYFASNPAVSAMYGYLNGSAPSHCQKDFFTDTQVNPVSSSGDLGTDILSCSTDRCQYTYNKPTLSGTTIPNHKQITLYVDGDVTITSNITYDSTTPFDATDPLSIPYFALVVKGNIYVSDNVTQLDGLYVAQYKDSNSPGEFATCDQGNACTKQLVVNGAVIAQHVELMRKHGTEDQPPSDVNLLGHNPAEVFNYVPSMIIGAPAFGAIYGQSEGTFSLAPVF